MKAWKVTDLYDEAWLLIYASTGVRARNIAFNAGLWQYESYTDVKATRAKEFDGLFDCEKVVETNDDLPEDSPNFYSDEL